MDYQIKNIIIVCLIALTYWISITIYRINKGSDIESLRRDIFKDCNGWCVSHIIQYMVMGFIASKYWYISVLIGVGFEFVEMLIENHIEHVDSNLIKDSVINSLGVLIGICLQQVFKVKIDLSKLLFY